MRPITSLAVLLPPMAVVASTVKTGLNILIDSNYVQLAGRRVLVLSNPTGVDKNLDLGVDVMFQSGQVDLVGVMGPEHGFRGTSPPGGGTSTFTDPETGLTVYNAYDVSTATLMSYIKDSGADTIVFDIQDVGARFYTYTWAMYDTMVAAAASNVSYVVLDRPNPLTGLDAFGPVLNESYVTSYVGRRAISQAHGMTSGELANMFVGEGWIQQAANTSTVLDLSVISMEGWERSMTYEQTGIPWVIPSPNMPTTDTAMIYPGACMFEGTSFSVGRGTARPYEFLAAPWANQSWPDAMREQGIKKTTYRFNCVTPTTDPYNNDISCGLQTYLFLDSEADYANFDPIYVGLTLLYTARHLYTVDNNSSGFGNTSTSFHWTFNGPLYDVDVLTGSPLVREGIEQGLTPEEIKKKWTPELEKFKTKRAKYLMYK